MKVPRAEHAFVDERKLVDYCLNAGHPRGRHKARVFLSVLGFGESSAPIVRAALLEAVRDRDGLPGEADEHGQRYTVDFPMTGVLREATIRSIWIIRSAENFPRLVSCYIL
jgi:hypothetical protein